MSLATVRTFSVPRDLVRFTEKHLRRAGSAGYELFVFWTGVIEGDRFEVRHGHVPHQTARKTRHGLSVEVGGDALHRLNVWLYENSEVLGAQVVRESHIVAGARCCTYRVSEMAEPAPAAAGSDAAAIPDGARAADDPSRSPIP